MTHEVLIYRARWSFPDRSEPLLETGRLMARWSAEAAACLAPELTWRSHVVEHADYGVAEEWQASHVIRLEGMSPALDATRVHRGRGSSTLAAGGRGPRVGGTGRVRVETVASYCRLDVDNHCDVTHWDIDLGPVSDGQIFALQASLERILDADVTVSGEHRDPIDRVSPTTIASDAAEDDLALWTSDLTAAGFEVVVSGGVLALERSSIETFDALDAALITVGEVLAEAGETEWERRALDVLRSVPHGGASSRPR